MQNQRFCRIPFTSALIMVVFAVLSIAHLQALDKVENPATVRQTRFGYINGTALAEGTALAWLGVPYAKPPVGELRWQRPEFPEPWDGVRETGKYGSRSLQPSGGKVAGNEDCLYLNIWRPATTEKNLPVWIHLHGGSNQTGSGEAFDGKTLAVLTNSVVVSINYRLGALGWLNLPALKTGDPINDSGNWGLLDAAKAMEWVQDNIVFFGGNPGNVTISGSSAGGRDCLALMISPLGKNLFHKAMIFGGGLTVTDPALAQTIAEDVVYKVAMKNGKANSEEEAKIWYNRLSSADQAAWLRSLPAEEFIPPMRGSMLRMGNFPHLMRDGAVIPQLGFKFMATERYDPIPSIVGSADYEFSSFAARDPYFIKDFTDFTLVTDEAKREAFVKIRDAGSNFYNYFNLELVLEYLYSNQEQPPCYAYRFGWGLNPEVIAYPYNLVVGGAHTSDNPIMTNTENYGFGKACKEYYTEKNLPGRQDLSRVMMAYFRNFIHTGNPNGDGLVAWLPWFNGNEQFLHFDADTQKAMVGMKSGARSREQAEKYLEQLSDQEKEIFTNVVGGRFFYDTDF